MFVTTRRAWNENEALSRTRNIGIIAHIDAGKTTTTERMLFYSGHTRRIGDVDDGSTVTDFLPAERARGITIQSAAISFNWPPSSEESSHTSQNPSRDHDERRSSLQHNINLIDTPGHADFTFEVLRSLRILDGAVCILDGVAGVEAQTEKVWLQANHYQIPRIIFVNKLDRDGAAFHRTIKEIGSRLHTWPAICQIPWFRSGDRKLCGVGDVVGLRALRWEEGSDGRAIQLISVDQLRETEPGFAEELLKARVALVELLSEHDDLMVESFLEHNEDHVAIPSDDIVSSLQRCTLQFPQHIVAVLAGASFRNIGVQPLLDAIVDLLPSPQQRPDPEVSLGNNNVTLSAVLSGNIIDLLSEQNKKSGKSAVKPSGKLSATLQNLQGCALAFKVVNDPKRGVLVYVRVYHGSIGRGLQLFNTNLSVTERAPKLLKMFASDAVDIPSIDAGQIGVIVGLKYTRTGDTLLSYTGMSTKTGPPAPLNALQLKPINVPPPVFFTSVEPASLSEEKQIADTLQTLLREDPSLNVSSDPESGQTHLAGMGELHLEIARDRLIQDFKANAQIGSIEINYRETVEMTGKPCTSSVDRDIGGKRATASCTASICPTTTSEIEETDTTHELSLPEGNHLTIIHPTLDYTGQPFTPEDSPLPANLRFPVLLPALQNGVVAALARGPAYQFPIHSTHITLTLNPPTQISSDTTPAAISVAAREAVKLAIDSTPPFALMEPVMLVTLSVQESDLGSVVHDLSSARGGQILSLDGSLEEESQQPNTYSSQLNTPNSLPRIDTNKIYAPPDPYASTYNEDSTISSGNRQVLARVPLREMIGYLKYLRSLTGGRGTFVMSFDRFEKVSGQRLNGIIREIRGQVGAR